MAPLSEYDERCRMATRLQVAWPWLLGLTLVSAAALHALGLSGLVLLLGPPLGGLGLTMAVVLQARRPHRRATPAASGEPELPLSPPQTA